MQINLGTQWDVASIGCTDCIKINFADEVVLFIGSSLWCDFDLLKKKEFCHGFQNI